jgi:hypothetical protein
MTGQPEWQRAWKDLRRRTVLLAASVISLPGSAVLVLVMRSLGWGYMASDRFIVLAGMEMLAMMLASAVFHSFPCPRCHRRFFFKGIFANSFARRCLHCGLRKGADPPSEPAGSQG